MIPKSESTQSKTYDKHLVKTFDDYLKFDVWKTDFSIMQKNIKPIILDIKMFGIRKPINFNAILKDLGINRDAQLCILKKLAEQYGKTLKTLSKRQLSHTNSTEKNILFTYFSLFEPCGTYLCILCFIQQSSINMKNKKHFLCELLLKIQKIHGKPFEFACPILLNSNNDDSNSNDHFNSDNDDSVSNDHFNSDNNDSASTDTFNSDNDDFISNLNGLNMENDDFNVLNGNLLDYQIEDDYFNQDFFDLSN